MSAVNACQKKPASVRYAAVLFVVAFTASQLWNSAVANKTERADKTPEGVASASPPAPHHGKEPAPVFTNVTEPHLHNGDAHATGAKANHAHKS
ncbi:hypothetical protein HPB52_005696 [Rhipicephalus sanguineus]|uniref:Uncharacterized protein n=1 Tax=Rhipicephalus sanguineus TaxID=34632 RepID=A0A9D4PHX9_RHISA|nr:hypothetical protein HPB52_005696 [Rhipicephalus sanguineus]